MSNPRNRVFSVFAGDLSFFCEEVDLYQLFRPFGEILRATIVRGKEGKSAKKTSYFGFVDFPTRASAQRAIEALHGKMYLGRIMAVNSTETTAPKKNYRAWHKVAIGFTAVCDWSVDEQCLRDMFEEFGPLADVVVRDYDVMGSRVVNGRKMTEATGYADVYFLDVRQAMRAVEAVTYAEAVNGSSLSRHRWIRLSLLNPDDVAVIGAQQRSLRPALSAGDVQHENANKMLMQEQYARRLTDSYLFHEQMPLENSFSLGFAPSLHSRPLSLTPHQHPLHDFERGFEREIRGFDRDALGDIYHDGQFSRSNDHLMNFSTTGFFERERLYESIGDLPTPPQDFHHDLVALRSRDLQGGRPVVDGFPSLEWEAMYAPFSRENTSSIPLGSVDGNFMNDDGGWTKHPPSSFPGTDMETLLGLSSGSATFGA